jgi:orotate phosphoribosyltransferase
MAQTDASTGLGRQILDKARELDALLFGDFTLTSGEKSSYYFDGRLLTLSPKGSNLVAKALLPAIRAAGADAVGGPAVAAVPLVTEIAMLSGQDGGRPVPAFFVRTAQKEHGMGKLIEGPVAPASRVAIVDDACSTAGSLYHAIYAAEEAGHTVVFVGCVLDRNQGGSAKLKADGYPFYAVLEGDAEGNVKAL